MRQNVTEWDFVNAFESGMYKNNFTQAGLFALYNHLTEMEEGMGEEMDFDIVAIACEYNEYASLAELQEDYTSIKSREELEQETQVIDVEGGGIIIVSY